LERVEVFSIDGKQVALLTPNATRAQFNVNLPSGVYGVTIQTDKGIFSDKLIVK